MKRLFMYRAVAALAFILLSAVYSLGQLPSGWLDTDIGNVPGTGSATYSGGTLTVLGSGTISGTSDQFHFVYQQMTGDGSIIAHVSNVAQGGALGGVMIRETLSASSAHVAALIDNFNSSYKYAYVYSRALAGGSTSSQSIGYPGVPYWLKLVRSGNTFSMYMSADRFNWSQSGTSVTVAMAPSVYVGLAVAGTATATTATFDHISINSTTAPAPVITNVSATTVSMGSQVAITGANFGAAQGLSAVLLNGAAVAVDSWSDTGIVFTVPTGATSGLLAVAVAPTTNESNPVWVTITANPLPAGWLDTDIGRLPPGGSATNSNGMFTVVGSGQISGTSDKFHFVYQTLAGDGSIVARVVGVQPAGATVGLMMRESLAAGSAFAAALVDNASPFYVYLRSRAATGASASSQNSGYPGAPYWLKLVRSGNIFTMFLSADRANWSQVGTSITINLQSTIYVGLACSGSYSEIATFDHISINSTTAPAPVITNVSATTVSMGSQVAITGANFGAAQGLSAVLLNGAAVAVDSWSDTGIVFTVPTGATSGLLAVAVAPTMNESNTVYVSVTPQPLPAGWLDTDVGNVPGTGSATYSGGAFTERGSGTISGTSDQFHFVYQPLTGDGSIIARMTAGGSWNGLMIRETLSANSAYAAYLCNPVPGYLYGYLYYRTTAGSSSTSTFGGCPALPSWVKLVRTGNTFTAFTSADGVSWAQKGSVTIAMAASVSIGVWVGGYGTPGTAVFDHVSVTSSMVTPPVITTVTATTVSVGTQMAITGAHFGTAQGLSALRLNGAAVAADSWTDTRIVFTAPAGATSGLLAVAVAPTMNESNTVYVSVTPQPLPAGWLDTDVGNVPGTGSATYSGGAFTVVGSGTISGASDQFHFVYQPLTGDGSIIARMTAGGSWNGLMIRETLSANSAYAAYFCGPPSGYWYYRTTAGTGSTTSTSSGCPALPSWVKVVRTGNTFTAFTSVDGVNWAQKGSSLTIAMAASVSIGVWVGGYGTPATAVFDHVAISFGTTPFVSAVTPLLGGVGTTVTVDGSNFGDLQGSSVVKFNGVPAASISSWTASEIVAAVPSSIVTGTGPVTVVVNSIESPGTKVFSAMNPVLNGISPPAATTGATVVLSGSGFTLAGQTTKVSFNGADAELTSVSSTSLTAIVPNGATTGPVAVSIGGYSGNSTPFTVEPYPTITGISPASGPVGTLVTITGQNFGSAQSDSLITFNDLPALIKSWSDTEIDAVVPDGATYGPVVVQAAGVTVQGPIFDLDMLVTLTDSFGHNTTYESYVFGGRGRATNINGPGCSSCSMSGPRVETYDGSGNVLTVTDALSHTITNTYDGSNNVTSISAQLDTSTPVKTTYTYNNFGEVLTATDPLGNVTTNAYDPKGNLISITSPKPDANTPASVTQFAYDTKGQLTTITDPLSHVTTLAYTPEGLIASITDANQKVTTYEYDPRGNRTAVVDALQNRTTFAYDTGNRLTSITYPDSTTSSFAYDSRGRRTSVTDQNGKVTTYAYDDADRLTTLTDAAGNSTSYAYDTESNLLSITDANGHTTAFDYDAYRRVAHTNFPSGLSESYGYDPIGNLTSKTDRKGQTITFVYDALNRLSHKGYPDSTGVEYVYDLVGKIQHVAGPSGAYGFAYDNMGRLIGTTTQYSFLLGVTLSNTYGYDAASNRTSFQSPDGSSTTYAYDPLNRLTDQTNSWAGHFTFSYDDLSRRTSLNRPNGINTAYNYDNLSRLLSVLHQAAGPNNIDGATYGYDNAGNRTSKLNLLSGINEHYSYDVLYQLTQVLQDVNGGSATSESYTFDKVRNRLSSLGLDTWLYNSSNELTSTPSTSFTYDNNGNTLTKSDADGTTTYTWDFENRLASAFVPSTGTTTYRYDPFGRRTQKSGPPGTTTYVHDGANIIAEYDGTGALAAKYAHGAGVDQPLAMWRGGRIGYYQADALSSITSLTDTTGSPLATYTYEAFGRTTATGTLFNPFQYTGREWDQETGLYYYRARYYDPQIGRFLSEDPIQFLGGTNFYSYAANAPLRFLDPTGTSNSSVHEQESTRAALDAGFSYGDAIKLADQVAAVDFRRGSQGTDPAHTHMHAMAGDGESCGEAYWGALDKLKEYMANGDVAGALHEIQDSYASGHLYKPWKGGLPGPSHIVGDAIFHPEAVAASTRYLRDYNNGKKFDSPATYLVSKPTNCFCTF